MDRARNKWADLPLLSVPPSAGLLGVSLSMAMACVRGLRESGGEHGKEGGARGGVLYWTGPMQEGRAKSNSGHREEFQASIIRRDKGKQKVWRKQQHDTGSREGEGQGGGGAGSTRGTNRTRTGCKALQVNMAQYNKQYKS